MVEFEVSNDNVANEMKQNIDGTARRMSKSMLMQ
jgi:hypothetical protein